MFTYYCIFLHSHIFSHENFTLRKYINLQNCPATKQRKSLSVNFTLIATIHTKCKITNQV